MYLNPLRKLSASESDVVRDRYGCTVTHNFIIKCLVKKKGNFFLFASLGIPLDLLGLLDVFLSVRVLGFVLQSLYLLRGDEEKPHPATVYLLSAQSEIQAGLLQAAFWTLQSY